MRRGVPWALAALALACAGPPERRERESPQAELTVSSPEADAELEGEARAVVLRHLRLLLARCSLDSIQHPVAFPLDDAAAWSAAASGPRLQVRLGRVETFGWLQGRAAFSELLLELPPGAYPGHLLGRGPEGIVQFTKCSGSDLLELVCLRELGPLLPATYGQACESPDPG